MKRLWLSVVGLGVLLCARVLAGSDEASPRLRLVAEQKEFLTLEPILVTVQGTNKQVQSLPPGPGKLLRFDVKPALKPRGGAKPLPVEGRVDAASKRTYDLLEWFQFPAEGAFTVQAVIDNGDSVVASDTVSITLRRPGKTDAEWGPVDRLHHIPWSNYVTDAFCGDTFDVVKRWPDSKLARYCHYYNGLHHQHKKEYDKAVASFRIVTEKHADFILADAAQFAMAECLFAQKKTDGAAVCLAKQLRNRRVDGSALRVLNERLGAQILVNSKGP
jgi:hypothetical protein